MIQNTFHHLFKKKLLVKLDANVLQNMISNGSTFRPKQDLQKKNLVTSNEWTVLMPIQQNANEVIYLETDYIKSR